MDNGKLEFIINGVKKGVAIESADLKTGEYFITLTAYSQNDKLVLAQAQIQNNKNDDFDHKKIMELFDINDKDFKKFYTAVNLFSQ